MTAATKQTILQISKRLFAKNGYEGFSIRILSKESGVGLSSIYHFFHDKDELLKEIFDRTNKGLGAARAKLSSDVSAEEMLRGRILFQFQHIEDVIFVLKYFLHFRPNFLKLDSGYLPTKGYLHIEEVLQAGVASGEFAISSADVESQSKVIAHAINGFLLEYYPDSPSKKELSHVTDYIHEFLMRSLTNKEVIMK